MSPISARRRLPLHTFRRRLYQARAAGLARGRETPSAAVTPHFLPVTVLPDPPHQTLTPPRPLELILASGRRVAVAPGFDPDTLRLLIDVLEGRPCSA